MDRQERLDRTADVYEAWIAKYDDIPGFDPNNPTQEQADDYYFSLRDAIGTVGSGEFAKRVAKLSDEELAQLRTLPIYQETSLPGL
jgi:hypothetical protein